MIYQRIFYNYAYTDFDHITLFKTNIWTINIRIKIKIVHTYIHVQVYVYVRDIMMRNNEHKQVVAKKINHKSQCRHIVIIIKSYNLYTSQNYND